MARLLHDSSLSPEGVEDFLEHFRLVFDGTELVGMVGIEPYGPDGLLRSLAVRPSHRTHGIAGLLVRQAIEDARRLGIKRLVLLTTTASGYFVKHGFRTVDRTSISGGVTGSSQFRGACPAGATCMELTL